MSNYKIDANYKFYMYDRQTGETLRFGSETEFIMYLAEKGLYSWKKDAIQTNRLVDQQNFTGTDTSVFVYDTWNGFEVVEGIRRFTFYRQLNNQKPAVIDIKHYIDAIDKAKDVVRQNIRRKNRFKQWRHRPYQMVTHRPNAEKYVLCSEDMEYIVPTSRRTRGNYPDYYSSWDYKSGRSQRCWKKQTKRKHQYGNDTRDKHLESYYSYFGNDIDRMEYEKNMDTLLTEDFMAA